MYAGAAIFTGTLAFALGDGSRVAFEPDAIWVLAYLGVMPTAVGFYLWNKGAVRVAPGALAAANNLKIPFAVVAAWLVFGETAPYARVLVGLAVIVGGLTWTAKRDSRADSTRGARSARSSGSR
jgi:drug/metabolite transporter (DMT)-like permease